MKTNVDKQCNTYKETEAREGRESGLVIIIQLAYP